MKYTITDEYSTAGEYSLKCISSNWQWLYYNVPPALRNQISNPFSFKCDVCANGGDLLIVVTEGGVEKQQMISLSQGEYTVEISYTPESYDFGYVQLGYRSKTSDEKTCYIDNIRLYY